MLRIASGSTLPLNKSEPKPTGKATPPGWMDREALVYWAEIAPKLESMGILTSIDSHAFGILCQSLADIDAATKMIRDEGRVFESTQGRKFVHPAEGLRDRAQKTFVSLSTRFGLTPADRTRIKAPSNVDQDDFEERMLG
jgi:P27 family predicted phage terminase small subunit